MNTNRKGKLSALRAATLPALVVGLFAAGEAFATPPAHAPAYGWRSMQEGYPPGPPPHAPAYGWRGMQEGYGPGPRIPGADEEPRWWDPWMPGYDPEREWRRQWQREYSEEPRRQWEREYRGEQPRQWEREQRGRRGGPPSER